MALLNRTITGPEHGGVLDPIVTQFLKEIEAQNAPPLETLPLAEARQGCKGNILPNGRELESLAKVEDRIIKRDGGSFSVRLYIPEGEGPFPVLIYYHGGGWVLCGVDTHESATCSLANVTQCIVAAVEYRLAPEHKFPIPAEDAYSALQWVYENAADFEGDPKRIAVGGDSAGGNLSTVMCLMTRDRKGPAICHQLLIYPVTDLSSFDRRSYSEYAKGFFLTRAMMVWFRDCYLWDEADRKNIYASPLLAEDLSGLPPAHFVMAEFDPLFDEGEAYAERLIEAGVSVKFSQYNGLIHGFINRGSVIPHAKQAIKEAAAELRKAFDSLG